MAADLVSSNKNSALENSLSEKSSEISHVSSKAGMVGFLTFLSRLFGLGRDTLIAYLLGAREAADAFYVAFRIPNLLRRLLAEGCLTISFIPVFTEYLKKDRTEAKRVADYTFTLLSLLLFVITLIGVIGAAFFVKFTAFGFTQNPEKFALTVQLTRVTFPYIFLVSLGALAMGILNSLKHFSTPAASPILLNVGIILGALLLRHHMAQPSMALAIGVLLGGVLQILLQIPPLIKLGFLPKIAWNPKHPGVKKILGLMLPSIYGSAVYQLNLFAITFMASFLSTGAVSYLWYADRVMEFPLGIFAISFATVILPQLSDHAADKDIGKLKQTFREGLLMVYFVNVPATVGLIVLAQLIISVLFEHGNFSPHSTLMTSQALQCFALGLPFVSGTRITASAFYAVQDSRTPVRAANLAVIANIVVGAMLLKPLGHKGLALGVATGSFFNFYLHIRDFRKKLGLLGLRASAGGLIKILVASLGMGIFLFFAISWVQSFFGNSTLDRMGALLILILGGVLVYSFLAYIFGVKELRIIIEQIKRKWSHSES
jgi:putative peptidoglycan lipid II flippase